MLKARLITALILVSGFLAALFLLPDLLWASLMLAVIVIGAWEWGRLAQFTLHGQRLFGVGVLMTGLAMLPDLWSGGWVSVQPQVLFWLMFSAMIFWLLLAPVWLLTRHRETGKYWLTLAGIVVLVPAWLALVHLRKVSPWLVLALMATVWIADSAAYFAGKRFGRHKLAPEISPGKTWEGVIGACLAVSLYAVVLCVSFNLSLWLVVGLWGITILSIIGDLFESLLKRQSGLKDSGNLLPGHGGVLDRIDGLTSTLPLAAFYIHFPIYYAALYD